MKEVFNRTLAALYTIIWRILIWILESYFTLIFFRGIKIQIFKNCLSFPQFSQFLNAFKVFNRPIYDLHSKYYSGHNPSWWLWWHFHHLILIEEFFSLTESIPFALIPRYSVVPEFFGSIIVHISSVYLSETEGPPPWLRVL